MTKGYMATYRSSYTSHLNRICGIETERKLRDILDDLDRRGMVCVDGWHVDENDNVTEVEFFEIW